MSDNEKNRNDPIEKIEKITGFKYIHSTNTYERTEEWKLQNTPDNQITRQIILPGEGKHITTFCTELVKLIKHRNDLFFKVNELAVVKIETIEEEKEDDKKSIHLGFKQVTPNQLISYIERHTTPGIEKLIKREGREPMLAFFGKSLNKQVAGVVLEADQFRKELPFIEHIFTAPIPLLYKNELTFPKKGYDKRFNSWLEKDSPEINTDIKIEEAKKIINEIYSEFCFKDEQDKTNAIAGLLTPFLRGLYPEKNCRTPIYFYEANRERAGKDYCAGITGLIYEGEANEETAISTEDNKKTAQGEELKKKLLGSLRQGKKRLHFANNKGYMANAILEGFSTAKTWNERLLGKNENLKFDNDIEISISANAGLTYTADLGNRIRKVRLFLAEEDPNKRIFKHNNLHQEVKDKRGEILSALYSFVNDWHIKGMPKGKTLFTSFPEWAEICGGIMTNANLGDPCTSDKELLNVGGDVTTQDFKVFVEFCYEKRPNEWMRKDELRYLAIASQTECEIFKYYDFENKSHQIKFGTKLQTYFGRIFSGITIMTDSTNSRKSRHTVKFSKNNDRGDTSLNSFGNDGNVGNDSDVSQKLQKNNNNNTNSIESIPTLPTLPILNYDLFVNNFPNKIKISKISDYYLDNYSFTKEQLNSYIDKALNKDNHIAKHSKTELIRI